MGAALKFKQINIPRQAGEQARLRVIKAPGLKQGEGVVFVLTQSHASIGRGEENDIMIQDLRASRKHVELKYDPTNHAWIVTDTGSANGILHNQKVTRQATLYSGDQITVGETTFEFLGHDVETKILKLPVQHKEAPNEATIIKALHEPVAQHRKKVAVNPQQSIQSKKKINPLFLIIGAIAIAVVMLMPDASQKQKKVKAKDKISQAVEDAMSLGQQDMVLDEKSSMTAESFFKIGFREYRATNYLRAKTQFENVLQINPAHRLALIYLQNCERAIDFEIQSNLEQGKRAMVSAKWLSAKNNFETVVRMLSKDQTNPHYKEAQDQLVVINQQLNPNRFDSQQQGGRE